MASWGGRKSRIHQKTVLGRSSRLIDVVEVALKSGREKRVAFKSVRLGDEVKYDKLVASWRVEF